VEGDAKWYFDLVLLKPGDYVFSDWYRSNVDTEVTLAVVTNTETTYIIIWVSPLKTIWIKAG